MRQTASLLIVPVALAAIASACRLPERHDFSTRVEERTLELKPGGELHAVTFNGSIDLEGWDRNEVQLVAKIREYRQGDVRFTAESKDGRVTIRAERENAREGARPTVVIFGLNESGGASLTVKMPRKTFATLHSSNGRIEIRGVDGEIDANTTNASIIANEIGAKARLTTSNGAVSADGVKGELFVRTSNSGINASDIAGEADLRSSNGRIEVRRVSGKTEATTSNASITAEEIGAFAKLTTSNGTISAALVKGDVFARTSNGSINVKDVTGEADLRSGNGRITARNVKGKLEVFTSSGSITAENIESDFMARSSNGTIDINGVKGAIDAETTNASIKATDLDGKGRGIRLVTSNGSINVNLGRATGTIQARASDRKAVSIEIPNVPKPAESGEADGVVNAKVGNSDQLIELKTTHGRITVR